MTKRFKAIRFNIKWVIFTKEIYAGCHKMPQDATRCHIVPHAGQNPHQTDKMINRYYASASPTEPYKTLQKFTPTNP